MQKFFGTATVVLLSLAGIFVAASPAAAVPVRNSASGDRPFTWSITSSTDHQTVTLTLSMSARLAQRGSMGSMDSLVPMRRVLAPNSPPPPDGGSYAELYCNNSYSFPDSNGVFTYQHACGGSTSPWGFSINSSVRAIITGNVSEVGMSWTRNGATMPRQSPHTVPSNYTFHGTFNPMRAGDYLDYWDDIDFSVNVGGNPGHGYISIQGHIHQNN